MRAGFAYFVRGDKRQKIERGWIVKLSMERFPLHRRVRADTLDQARNSCIVWVGQFFTRACCLYVDHRQIRRQEDLEEVAIARLSPREIERNSNGVVSEYG